MKSTKSTWQEKLEINQPVIPCSTQTYFFQLLLSEHWVPWQMPKNSGTMLLRGGPEQGQSLVDLGTASQGWQTGKLLPGCPAGTRWASLVIEGHIQYTKVHPVHPSQMVYEINFKF